MAVTFATAHPAKFDEAIALTGIKQEFPAQISALFEMPQHMTVVEHDKAAIVRELQAFYG
ncbi:threonine synthase [compost metagenome]